MEGLLKIDSIEKTRLDCDKKIDSICATFDLIVSTIDSVKKTDSMQNYRLNRVRAWVSMHPSCSYTKTSLLTALTWLLKDWLEQLKAGRQKQENQTRSRTMKTCMGKAWTIFMIQLAITWQLNSWQKLPYWRLTILALQFTDVVSTRVQLTQTL